jgi:hypothetical protein
MKMQHPVHPDDERLAALAGGDPEAGGDASLRQHVSACDRCAPLVDDLASLHRALAELPDMAPNRPLQLVPPVREPAAAEGGIGWLRRLAGPAMAAGAGLVLVGAVGMAGVFEDVSGVFENVGENLMGDQAAEITGTPTQNGDGEAFGAASDAARESVYPAAAAPSQDAETGGTPRHAAVDPSPREAPLGSDAGADDDAPWLVVLLSGAAVAAAGTAIRYGLQPR